LRREKSPGPKTCLLPDFFVNGVKGRIPGMFPPQVVLTRMAGKYTVAGGQCPDRLSPSFFKLKRNILI